MAELRVRATAGQRSLWVMEQLSPGGDAYNIAFVARARGSLDAGALERAVGRLVARHDALRTTFREEGALLLAVVHDELPAEFVAAEPCEDVPAAVARAHRAPLSLVRGPLLRVVVQPDGDGSVLLVTAHHAIADFHALEILLDELGVLYLAERGQGAGALPEAPQFVDALAEDPPHDPQEALAHWRHQLADPPPTLRWPVRPSPEDAGPASHFFSLDAARTSRLRAFCAASGASAFVVALAVWGEVLSRITGQSDQLVGVPSSLRPSGYDDCVGFFVNPLPLRLRSDPAATFAERVRELLGVVLSGLEHRWLPFADVVSAVSAAREPGRNPLFQTMIIVQRPRITPGWAELYLSEGGVEVDWGGLRLAPFRMAQQEGQVDLALELCDATDRIACSLRCRTEIVPAAALPRLAEHFCALLDRLLAEPERPMGELSATDGVPFGDWLASIDRAPLLPPPADDLVARILAHARRAPEREAISDPRTRLTYGQLDARTLGLAHRLRALGLRPGGRVGVALPPSVEAVVAMLGAMRAGGAYVPLDPAAPIERLRRTVEKADVGIVIGDLSLPGRVAIPPDEAGADGPPLPLPGPEAPAYTLFTSGSTGEPKGIEVRQGSVTAMLDALAELVDTDERDVWSWFHAASFDLSVGEIWAALCSGARLVVVPSEVRARPDAFLDLLEQERVTAMVQTPSAMRSLADEIERRGEVSLRVRHMISCGEVLPGATARRLLGCADALWNMYGPAEATVYATAERITPGLAAHESVPVGAPMRHDTLLVLDDRGRPAPTGALGEIWLGGHGIAVGYVGLPRETEQRFVSHPVAGRLYRTGDFGAWDGQRLHFHGRRDNQVKVRGYRIELDEVETALGELGDVSGAAVIVEPTAHGGQLAALIVPADPASPPGEAAIRRDLGAVLPAYMVPSRIVFAPSLPLNAHGKVSRAAVAARLAERTEVAAEALPTDPIEGRIAEIWCRVLSRPRVGTEEPFFEIGGSSASLMRVYAELRQLPAASALTPTDLFRYPTVRALAERLRAGDPRPGPAVRSQRIEGLSRLARRRNRD